MREEWRVRRLYAAPVGTSEATPLLACSCSRPYVPYFTCDSTLRVLPAASTSAPPLSLPFPAIDMAWCGVDGTQEHSEVSDELNVVDTTCPITRAQQQSEQRLLLLTTCRSQPMQLWRVDSGLRLASFVALNRSGAHCHAQAVMYLPTSTPSPDAISTGYVVGGYGDFEDTVQVRVYDIHREGNEPLYCYRRPGYTCTSRSEASRGLGGGFVVTALTAGPPALSHSTSLILCGYRGKGVIDVIDHRHRSPAALLSGLRSGTSLLRCNNNNNTSCSSGSGAYCVYAAGRAGEDDVCCWDLRRPGAVLARFTRCVRGTQPCEFVLFPSCHGSSSSSSTCLVSATSDGGIVVFDEVDKACGVVQGRNVLAKELGPTSSLAMMSSAKQQLLAVVVCGGRRFVLPRKPHGAAALVTRQPCGRKVMKATSEDCEEEVNAECEQGVEGRPRKRPRSPTSHTREDIIMSSSDEEEDDVSESSAAGQQYSETSPNITVISLADVM